LSSGYCQDHRVCSETVLYGHEDAHWCAAIHSGEYSVQNCKTGKHLHFDFADDVFGKTEQKVCGTR